MSPALAAGTADRPGGGGAGADPCAAGRLHGPGLHPAAAQPGRARPVPGAADRARRPISGGPPTWCRCWRSARCRSPLLWASAVDAVVVAVRQRHPEHAGRAGLQHRGQLRHEHQLAVLLRRDRAGLHGAGDRPDGAELPVRRGRDGRRGGADPRTDPPAHRPARQFLGRPHQDQPAGAAAAVVPRGAGAGGLRRHPEPQRHQRISPPSPVARRRCPAGWSPPRRRSRNSAPTAAGTSTPIPRTRSRTRPRSPTCSRSC